MKAPLVHSYFSFVTCQKKSSQFFMCLASVLIVFHHDNNTKTIWPSLTFPARIIKIPIYLIFVPLCLRERYLIPWEIELPAPIQYPGSAGCQPAASPSFDRTSRVHLEIDNSIKSFTPLNIMPIPTKWHGKPMPYKNPCTQ